jgi:MFS family permease
MTEGGRPWLNRNTVGIGLASLFSDISHELATAVLPAVLLSLGAGPAALGLIEGSADGLSAIAKLWGGVLADRLPRRKPLASAGYLVTAAGTAAIGLCVTWWQVLACRAAAWIGRGSRSASRDALLSEASPRGSQGRAFGLERAGDAAGAVIGPALGMVLLARGVAPRTLMFVSLLPGMLAFLSILVLVRERRRAPRPSALPLLQSLGSMGAPFRRYLAGILLFGSGDFSRTLLILYVTQHMAGSLFAWRGASAAVALYVLHNAVSASAALPIGAIADRVGHRRVIVAGYAFAAATTLGFALAPPTAGWMLILFVSSGLYIACEEVAEKSYAATLLPNDRLGLGMGLLAATNGIGDMISSALVGALWTLFPPTVGFACAALLQGVGAAVVARTPSPHDHAGR